MKRCQKPQEPTTLVMYRTAHPDDSWERMCVNPFDEGQQTYADIKHTMIRGQRCLCAFCERRIAEGMDDASLDSHNHRQRVEHFHPKEDHSDAENWALRWDNMWAVCLGGSQAPPEGMPFDSRDYLPPLPENLSCDAFKDHQIRIHKLPCDPEGWLLSPNEIPAFPLLFEFTSDGAPKPHAQNCATVMMPNNRYIDTERLVKKTIEHLNLGCARLNRNRAIARAQLEKRIQQVREQSHGIDSQTVMLNLARRVFSQNENTPWPEFFSLIRWRLGDAAEARLQEIDYAG